MSEYARGCRRTPADFVALFMALIRPLVDLYREFRDPPWTPTPPTPPTPAVPEPAPAVELVTTSEPLPDPAAVPPEPTPDAPVPPLEAEAGLFVKNGSGRYVPAPAGHAGPAFRRTVSSGGRTRYVPAAGTAEPAAAPSARAKRPKSRRVPTRTQASRA